MMAGGEDPGPAKRKEDEQPKTGFKISQLPPLDACMIIEVLKAGQIYERLLDGFETAFINEIAPRYAKYGLSTMIVGQQLAQFKKLAVKLNVRV